VHVDGNVTTYICNTLQAGDIY